MPIDSVEIKGLVETQQKLEQVIADLRGSKVLQGFRDITLAVAADAKRLAPVDTGRLRASITPEVRREGNTLMGVVGTTVEYAAGVELGTRPHMPPIAPLQIWAKRHGVNAWAVALKIKAKGTKPRYFFRDALAANERRIRTTLENAVTEIVTQ